MRSAMIASQIRPEATRAAILREQVCECVSPEVAFVLNKSTAPIAVKATSTTGETGTWKSLLRTSQRTLIGGLKQTPFRFNISGNQTALQQRVTLPMKAHSDRIELRRHNETKRVVERASAREQQPLFEYGFE